MSLYKSYNSSLSFDETDNTLIAKITSDAVDRYGEIVDAKGGQYQNYLKNPVVLLNHDSHSLPVAKALWVKEQDNNVVAKLKFADTVLGQEVAGLYKDGFLNAFSIGFMPKKQSRNEEGINVIKEWELFEFSAVTIPANPEALALSYKSVQSPILKESFEKQLQEIELKDTVKELKSKVSELEIIVNTLKVENEEMLSKMNDYDNQIISNTEMNDRINGMVESLKEFENKFNRYDDKKKNEILENRFKELQTILKV